FSNYSSHLASRSMAITSTNADIFGVEDTNCAATTTWPCSIALMWNSPPAGKNYGIYLVGPSSTSLVHCASSSGLLPINWISTNPYYIFDLYEITGTCNHPNPNAGAVKRASAEATPFGY